MKKISIFFILFSFLLLTSCEKDKLEILPHKIYYDNYYQNQDDALSAINSVYDVLGSVNQYNSNLWLIQDVCSDDCKSRTTLNDPNIHDLNDYTISPSNIYLKGIWEGSYLGISRANIVLEKVPDINMDTTLRNRILGEAKFLRSLFYFNMVRIFGDVPLVLKTVSANLSNDELYVSRTSKDVIYKQIIKDLDNASKVLPKIISSPNDKGRATKGAALAVLSKVYLTLEDWENAANKAKEVIDLGVYDLYNDYADNFKEANANGKESIFEVQFYSKVTSETSRIVISGLPNIQALFPAGVELIIPTEDLVNSFEEGDYRKDVTFFDHYWYYNFEPHIWKHWDQDAYEPDETGQSGANFPVMRYAEVLLIYAEALNEVNSGPNAEAYAAVNRIRERARHNNPDILPDLKNLNQDEFRDAVLKEKRCETVNEGQRWFDLVRTHKLIDYVKRAKGDKVNPQEFNYLFPIPQREIDINPNLTQNKGY